jgi:hypothetical protein
MNSFSLLLTGIIPVIYVSVNGIHDTVTIIDVVVPRIDGLFHMFRDYTEIRSLANVRQIQHTRCDMALSS